MINGFKYDLRIYVLVTDLGDTNGDPIICFVSDEGIVRFCTEAY